MASTLVVEDGSGLPNATSYATLSTIATELGLYADPADSTAWIAKTEAEQDNIARQSTLYLDRTYHLSWKGTKKTRAQRLDWPRHNVIDNDGWYIDSDSLPHQLVTALALLCGKVASGEQLDVDQSATEIMSESVSAGPVSRSVTYSTAKKEGKKFTLVADVLQPLLAGYGTYLGPATRG